MDSSQDEIGAVAILGAQLDEELGGGPVQVELAASSCLFVSSSLSSFPCLCCSLAHNTQVFPFPCDSFPVLSLLKPHFICPFRLLGLQ